MSRFFVLPLAVTLAACGAGDSPVASVFVKSVDVNAAEGATIAVDAGESPELAGTRLVIPPGSLAADTRITLRLQRNPIVDTPDLRAGPVTEWGPAGTQFTLGAELTQPFGLQSDQPLAALFLQTLEESGERAETYRGDLSVDSREARLAAATIQGFTRFGFGVRGCPSGDPAPGQVDHTCPEGTVCYRGRCQPVPETSSPEICDNDVDDDADGLVDCDDPITCDDTFACMEPEDCRDGIDNNADGLIDCADQRACGNDLRCACAAGGCSESCFDGVDNDGDDLADCSDPDCGWATCDVSCCWDGSAQSCVTSCPTGGSDVCRCSAAVCQVNDGYCP